MIESWLGLQGTFQCRTRLCGWCSVHGMHDFRGRKLVSMPHAALWVVQLEEKKLLPWEQGVSMPHAALWVVQPRRASIPRPTGFWFQCRTRLCWWCSPHAKAATRRILKVSMPHAALLVVQHFSVAHETVAMCRFNAARGFVGGAAFGNCVGSRKLAGFQCRTRLCWWCSLSTENDCPSLNSCFNAARGFVGGAAKLPFPRTRARDGFQCRTRLCGWCNVDCRQRSPPRSRVSMPHAALLVVQLNNPFKTKDHISGFQCRTRLCGWCSP